MTVVDRPGLTPEQQDRLDTLLRGHPKRRDQQCGAQINLEVPNSNVMLPVTCTRTEHHDAIDDEHSASVNARTVGNYPTTVKVRWRFS